MIVSDAPAFSRIDARCEELHAKQEPAILDLEASGRSRGLAKGIVALCDVLEIPLDEERVALLDRIDAPGLEALLEQIRAEHRWP